MNTPLTETDPALPGLDEQSLEALTGGRADPDWLARSRRLAWQAYRDGPPLNRAEHRWRYTDPDLLVPSGVTLSPLVSGTASALSPAPAKPKGLSGTLEVGPEGHRAWLHADLQAQGVILTDLATAAREHPDLVEAHLGTLLPSGSAGRFARLAEAFWTTGLFLYVPRRVSCPLPIVARIVAPAVEGSAAFPRSLVIVEKEARVELVEEHTGGAGRPGRSLVCGATEIHLDAAAQLTFASVERHASGVHHLRMQRARLDRDAHLVSVTVGLGGSLTRSDVGATLAAPGGETQVLGVVLGEGRQHFDYHTELEHDAPCTQSDLRFKVALQGRARSAYTGLLRITERGTGASAHQENHNLLLSERARADTIPELEILTNDLAASHGATVAPVDPEQVYYLQTRGYSPAEATSIIVEGFLEPILARVPGEAVRESLWHHVRARLGEG